MPREALCEVAPDGSDLAEKFDADADYADGWRAVGGCRRDRQTEHSWSRARNRSTRAWATAGPLSWPAGHRAVLKRAPIEEASVLDPAVDTRPSAPERFPP